MALSINTNIASLNAQRNLGKTQGSLTKSLERLSSGLRINSAKDDAAGLAISTRMASEIRGLNQASRNANDGISMAQTAEGALQESTNILQRVRELAIQSANSSNSAMDREALNDEVQSLLAEAQRISVGTEFNGKKLIDGSLTGARFHVGAYANQTITVNVGNAQNSSLGSYQITSGLTNVANVALEAGDLLINGTDVGASTSGSAESKAIAINGVSDQTGVTATASTELISTNALLRNQALQAGDLLVNGVNIGAVAGNNNVVVQGESISNAINAVSNQTGIQATHNQSTGALTLTSTSGKNIVISSTTAPGATRLENASGLEVSSNATASTSVATFIDGTAGTNAVAITAWDTDVATTLIAIEGDTVTIQGVTFEYTDGTGATGTNVEVDLSAVASNDNIATALNTAIDAQITASNLSNITTGVATNTVTLTSAVHTTTTTHLASTIVGAGGETVSTVTAGTGAAVGDTLNVGGVTYEFGFAGDTPIGSGNKLLSLSTTKELLGTNLTALVTAEYAAIGTNVQATDNEDGTVTFTSDLLGLNVANVPLTEPITTGTAGALTIAAPTAGTAGTNDGNTGLGTMELNSASSFVITGNNPDRAGMASAAVSQNSINNVDISTADGADDAIALLDGALSQIASSRGNLGAIQNRFESTISNLQNVSENISAARSRIMDADFAAETASLTKSQILQQARIAMLSQANQLPQAVLSLLQ